MHRQREDRRESNKKAIYVLEFVHTTPRIAAISGLFQAFPQG